MEVGAVYDEVGCSEGILEIWLELRVTNPPAILPPADNYTIRTTARPAI